MLKSVPGVIIGVMRATETTALFVLDVVQIYHEEEVVCPESAWHCKDEGNREIQATDRSTGKLTKPLSTEGFTGQNKLPVEQHCDLCGYCGISSALSIYLRLIEEIEV